MKMVTTLLLLLLFRIIQLIYRKKQPKSKNRTRAHSKNILKNDIVGESRVVLRYQSQAQTLAATHSESGDSEENSPNFESDNKPLDLQVELEYDHPNTSVGDFDEEVDDEDLRLTMKGDIPLASGFMFEDMGMAVREVTHPKGKDTTQAAEILYRMQNTECVAQLTAISPEKAEYIHQLINQHVETVIKPVKPQ